MEVTGIALQTISAGEDVAFTETAVNGTKCIVHRQGSGIIKLRGITNQCKARFLVSYSGNIQIPTGGTVGEISLAIAVDTLTRTTELLKLWKSLKMKKSCAWWKNLGIIREEDTTMSTGTQTEDSHRKGVEHAGDM